ncbi:ribonuclease J [Alphaproteobacteria bacterium]|nr:ribonuclease J [Alphaproteobacteria bacterium]
MILDKSDLIFLPVGGSEQIGMNANLYHYQDNWILIDLGISFPDETDLGIDVLLPDFEFIKSLKEKLLGIFLTHGHEDHIGAVPYFANEIKCPIWGTPFTTALLRRKLNESNKNHDLKIKNLNVDEIINLKDFSIKPIQTSHSIPDPVSFLISTKEGNLFHSGDWKLEQSRNLKEDFSNDIFKKIGDKGILAMICDSTNAHVQGRTPSETYAYDGLYETIKDAKKQVLVTCFSSNISRLKSLLDIARKTDRSVLVVGRALLRAIDAAKEVGYFNNLPEFVNIKDIGLIPSVNVLIICTGSQGEPTSALSRISRGTDKYISVNQGDTVIFSSRQIPGNENAISKVQNRFFENSVNVITDEDKNIHVSGHPSRDELVEMYSYIKPNISIPVHGTREHIDAHAKLAMECQVPNVIKPKNGDVIKLNTKKPSVISHKEFTTNVYDAGEIVSIDNERFISRRHTLWNGFVTVSLVLNNQGDLVCPAQVNQTGVSDNLNMDDFLNECSFDIEDFIEVNSIIDFNDEELKNKITKLVRKKFKFSFSKRPSFSVHINRI